MAWWREARFGMFIHYGLYSQLGRNEWVQLHENIPRDEYARLADTFRPREGICREWASQAKAAGMKYMVLTTRHHEGFSLWNSKVNQYNSFNACGRDIVAEFVDACREFGLGIGFYSSLMDWHHEDGYKCAYDTAARRRFPAAAGRLHRVYNGLELERFPFRPRADHGGPLRVAAVGRLVEKKGFADLVEAVRRLVELGLPVEVRLAGGGELHDELAERIRSAGLGDRFALLGPRTQAEVRELLDWCDVFAAPSVVGADGNADGLPTVLLEAMASGAPCVATDVTGIPEVVIDGVTGRLLPPADAGALADALAAIAHEPAAALAMTRTARALVEREFDGARQAAALADLAARPLEHQRAVA